MTVNRSFSFCSKMDKRRTETGAADMPPCQGRRRTWRCSGGEGLSSVIKLHGRWAVNRVTSSSAGQRISLLSPGRNHSSDLSLFLFFLFWLLCPVRLQTRDERAAGDREGLRGGAALRAAGVSRLLQYNHFSASALRLLTLDLPAWTGLCL